ncbi:MAG: glycosyltransferase family 4 protein [Thermoplasmata archaeon]
MIVLLSNPFRPDPRVRKEVRSLSGGGYDVRVLAWDRECIFPEEESVDGVRVSRLAIKSSFGQGILQMGGFLRFWWQTVLRCLQTEFDIVHCSDLDTLIPGVVVAKLRGSRVVFDAFECYPFFFSARFPYPLRTAVQKVLHIIERSLCLFVDHIITVSDYLGEHYRRFGKPVTILYNCPPRSFLKECSSNPMRDSRFGGKKRIVHIGGINRIRGLEKVLDCLILIRRKSQDIVFVNVGEIFGPTGYVKSVRMLVQERNLCDNFLITGWVDPATVPRYLVGSWAGLILFQASSYNAIIGLPNKLFEYMAAGVSVVASNFPSIAKVIREEKCGLLVDPSGPDDIASKIIHLLENPEEARTMGLNGRKAVEGKYNWDMMEERLLEVYRNL